MMEKKKILKKKIKTRGRSLRPINKIRSWPLTDVFGLLAHLQGNWVYPTEFSMHWGKTTGFLNRDILKIEMHTIGYSYNEMIIKELEKNPWFYNLAWYMSKVGGHYYFQIQPVQLGFQKVNDFCEQKRTYKQYIYKFKHKYDWIHISDNKKMVRLKKSKESINFHIDMMHIGNRKINAK